MNQSPAPGINQTTSPPVIRPSSGKKFLFLLLSFFILLPIAFYLLGKVLPKSTPAKPLIFPTPTLFTAPTMPLTDFSTQANSSASVSSRIAFLKEGDIYQTDLASFSLLVKNATPAADKLSWSFDAGLLAWRERSLTGVPQHLVVYDKGKDLLFFVKSPEASSSELLSYAWSPKEGKLALLWHDGLFYKLWLLPNFPSSAFKLLLEKETSLKEVIWPEENTLVIWGEEGISSLNLASSSAQLMVGNPNVFSLKLSPDRQKILYSLGDEKRSELYLLDLKDGSSQLIPSRPLKIDMGTANFPLSVIDNGFIPYALWFPDSRKILAGYHYQPNLPLAGIYDLAENSFTAVAPFAFYKDDILLEGQKLLSSRPQFVGENISAWILSVFQIDKTGLTPLKIIPDASSPAFSGKPQ